MLEASVETALSDLGFNFLKSQGRLVAEYEVTSPCSFRVLVEALDREQFGYPLRSPLRVESSVEVTRVIGAREPPQGVAAYVSDFVAALMLAVAQKSARSPPSEVAKLEKLAEIDSG